MTDSTVDGIDLTALQTAEAADAQSIATINTQLSKLAAAPTTDPTVAAEIAALQASLAQLTTQEQADEALLQQLSAKIAALPAQTGTPQITQAQIIAAIVAALGGSTSGTTQTGGGSTTPAGGGTVTPPGSTINYFPTDPASAPYPSPNGASTVVQSVDLTKLTGTISGAPYLRDLHGNTFSFGGNGLSIRPNGQGFWPYINGEDMEDMTNAGWGVTGMQMHSDGQVWLTYGGGRQGVYSSFNVIVPGTPPADSGTVIPPAVPAPLTNVPVTIITTPPVATISNSNSGVSLKAGVVFTGDAVGTAADPNVYPLAIPAAQPAGSTYDFGTGPNIVTIVGSNNPGGTPDAFTLTITKQDGSQHAIAVDVPVVSSVGETTVGADIFRFHGPWGSNPQMTIAIPDNSKNIINWIMNVTLDGVPYPMWGLDNSRGGGVAGLVQTFDSNDTAITLMMAANVSIAAPPASSGGASAGAAPVYNAVPSQISGATINGAAVPTDTLKNLLAAVPAAGTLLLPAGHFFGTGVLVNAATVEGAGIQQTIIDCTGLEPTQDKAVIVPNAAGWLIKNLSITGAAITEANGANAAAVREAGPGIDGALDTVEAYGCQEGELSFVSNITHTNCQFHDNGVAAPDPASGYEHDLYANGSLTIHGGRYWNPIGGHTVKCRGVKLTIDTGASIEAGGDGSAIDYPQGGTLLCDGITLVKPAGAADHVIVGLGMESAINGPALATFNNVAIKAPDGNEIIVGANGATLNLTGTNTYDVSTPSISGVTVSGTAFSKAA